MDTLIHADIFFFVTTIAVVVIALFFIIALIYLIKTLNRIKDIAEQVRQETVLFREDIHGLRNSVRQGFKIKRLLSFFQSFTEKRKSRKSK